MARYEDTRTFDTRRFESDRSAMRARREEVHYTGRKVYEETGALDPNVNVYGATRVSHNSLAPQDGYYILTNGIALPVVSAFDGTGSMGGNIEICFNALNALDGLLTPLRSRFGYNIQVSSGVAQDRLDSHPVAQMSQWETDNRIADQIRLLVPDKDGGDATEDYQLFLAFVNERTDIDIFNYYGLKGYMFLMADQICREGTSKAEIEKHLGYQTTMQSLTTKALCQAVARRFHLFYLQVGSGDGGRRNGITEWWEDKLGYGRIVIVPDPNLLAEVQVALIYATEAEKPTREEAVRLLVEGTKGNSNLSTAQANRVWDWIVEAKIPLGAQAKLRAGKDLPKPGDKFTHFRHAWPIGHPRAGENVTPKDGDPSTPLLPAAGGSDTAFDWGKF